MKNVDMSCDREKMVETQVAARGVSDPLVLSAMRSVPREKFISMKLRRFAYEDGPLPIEAQQTISQPYIVALMIEALGLEGGERVLEIGTGSGYAAAVLAKIASEVYTIERIKTLADHAAVTLKALNYHNVQIRHGDGTLGWPERSPFDAIVVAAGGPFIPATLQAQLRIGGRMVMPVGESQTHQELIRITRLAETEFEREVIADVRFVPLIGDEGWKTDEQSNEGVDGERTA